MFWEISQNSQENTCARVSFFNKVAGEVFSCDFYEISKNTFFTEHVWATASCGKKLRRHTFSSTCFCHHRKHPINGSKIYPLPSSSCFQQHSHDWFYILRYNSDLSKLEWTQLLFKFNYIRDLTNCSPFQSLNTLLFHIRIERY